MVFLTPIKGSLSHTLPSQNMALANKEVEKAINEEGGKCVANMYYVLGKFICSTIKSPVIYVLVRHANRGFFVV